MQACYLFFGKSWKFYMKIYQSIGGNRNFAIGLNMPTRSKIFTSLFKHDGYSQRILKSHEFIQMVGRAEERNIDKIGYIILLTNCYEPLDEQHIIIFFIVTKNIEIN